MSFTCDGYGKFWHHKQKHRKLSRYQCDLCSYSVGSNFCLVKHRQSHKNYDSPESYGTKMEEFIVMKDYYSEEISSSGMSAAEKDVMKEEQKGCIIKSPFETFRCKHCPYFGTDEVLFKFHEEMHVGHRQYNCNLCTYSSLCPISLHRHLNLHFPSLPSRSTAKNRKRLLRHRYHQSPETIPSDVKVHQCTMCPYKTAHEDRFQQHCLDHALHIQQRLTTSIKRAAQNTSEPFVRPKIRRPEKRSDRQFTCNKCSFRCDTIVAYNTHFEKHGAKSFFKCELCDYSSETKNIVDFHIATHHMDVPLSLFYKKAITNPEESQIKLKGDTECKNILNKNLVAVDVIFHWEEMHYTRAQKDDRRIIEELRMNMIHSSWIKIVR
ncbi:hypothetical protein DINM_003783 [Dirofilaria immitis]|nr:hypothetical protein [Dirofilaria immitis]